MTEPAPGHWIAYISDTLAFYDRDADHGPAEHVDLAARLLSGRPALRLACEEYALGAIGASEFDSAVLAAVRDVRDLATQLEHVAGKS